MLKTLSIIRRLLIPNGSRREKTAQTLQTLFILIRQQDIKTITSDEEISTSGPPSFLEIVLNQAKPRQIYHNLKLFWLRGSNSVSYLQMTYRYQDWMRKIEPDTKQLAQQKRRAEIFTYRPLISFLTPVYNPDVAVLCDTLQSVQNQTYPNWEFCLANGSTDPAVGYLLDDFAQQDERFRVIHLKENLGISDNTNKALQIAQGEFVAMLDHDDLVSPDMLFEVVSVLNQYPEWDVIYFDEDKVSEDGRMRSAPWFKPSKWSPDLLLSTNYLMHSVIRHQLVVDLGGFDAQMDGAQDWDLAFRLVEQTNKVHHIPRVFYHWRQVIGSAARDANAKPWAFAAQERCIRAHLQRQGYDDVQVSFPRLGTVRLIWPSQQAKVSIIIPTKNKLDLLRPCLETILAKSTYPNYEILVVDNQSNDPDMLPFYQSMADHPQVRILNYPHPYNFQKINNWAAHQSDGDVLLFLNNDTEVIEPTWLEEMVGWAMRPETGVVGTKLLRPNGKVQHAGIIMGLIGHGSHIFEDCDDHVYTHFGSVDWYRNYRAVTGACMAVRRSVFDELSGLDEAYIVGFGDIDFCLRAEDAGYRIVYTPFAPMLHHEGGTRGLSLPPSDVLRASVKMFSMVQEGDGFFNPNLSYSSRQPVVSAMREEERGKRLVRIMREFGLIGLGAGTNDLEKQLSDIFPELMADQSSVLQARSKPMSRILIVTHELTRSGAPIILRLLAQYFKEQGYTLQVICPVEGALKDDYAVDQIPVTVVLGLLDDARAVIPYLQETDVVICNTILTWRVVHAARALARPCLWWVHETVFGAELAAKQSPIAAALAAAAHVVFPSQTTAVYYHRFLNKQNHSFLHYGLNVGTVETAVTPILSKQPDEMHLICVATIENRKGQDVLLKAMAALPANIASKIHCHLIGRARFEPLYYLKIAWRSRWMRNVHLVGEIPNNQVLKYLNETDVFVLASRDEALPISLIEAMAYGKSIITTNAGGIAEVFRSGENGFIVNVEDSQALAEYITRLYHDPALRRKLGAQAQTDYQSAHTMSHFGKQMEQLLFKIYDSEPGPN